METEAFGDADRPREADEGEKEEVNVSAFYGVYAT